MPTVPTFDQLYELAKAEMQTRRPTLTDFREGSVNDTIAGVAAIMADESIRVGTAGLSELFFDTARGAALDRLALDRFGVTRKPAVAAIGVIEWTRDAAGAYSILAGTRFRAQVGTEIVVVQSLGVTPIGSGETTVSIAVQATTTGRSGNAAAGTVDEVVDIVVADPGATVTNPEPLAGGDIEEGDDAFRDRLRRIYNSIRRGTVGALDTGARSVPGVTSVTADESEIEITHIVNVYVGDPEGRSNTTLAEAVDAELVNWRAAGIQVDVLGSTREEKAIRLEVAIERGADRTAISVAIRASVVAYGDTLNPNETARESRIVQACHVASQLVIAARVDQIEDDTYAPAVPENAIRFATDGIRLSFTEIG